MTGGLALVLLIATSCDESIELPGGEDPQENSAACAWVLSNRPPVYDTLGFFEKLTFGLHIDYQAQASLEDLAAKAERVFIGNVVGVAQGQFYPFRSGGQRCERSVMHTTNLVFQVKQELRGKGPGRVVVEWPHSRFVFVRDLANLIPAQDMLVFLEPYAPLGPLPAGTAPHRPEDLSLFRTPLGLVTESKQELIFPLEPIRDSWLPFPGTTLAEVVQSLQSP